MICITFDTEYLNKMNVYIYFGLLFYFTIYCK